MPDRLRSCLVVALLALVAAPAAADESLHSRIDRLMDAAAATSPAPTCSDSEFARRASLDLIGIIPTAAEARAFLDDPAPNKREILVDRLLADPRHPLHLASVFNVMWMERRPDKHIPTAEWLKFLQPAFQQNKPYDQLVKEILSADSGKPETRVASKWLLDREGDPHLLTRDIGRIFFGVDLQCAQCHDHPLINDYLQTDYYGLFAFVNRTSIYLDVKDGSKAYLAEKADGVVEFKSVFTGTSGKTRPRLLGGDELDEPRFYLGEEYTVFPDKNVRPVPKFSRRELLATALADGSNPAFRRNIVNRLWALVMGRGLVHPVDLHHPANPPSHPEVLDLLAEEIRVQKFNLRTMLRELVLTKAYQRVIDLPAEPPAAANAESQLAGLKSEEDRYRAAAEAAKAEYDKLHEQLTEASKALVPIEEALAKAEANVATVKKPYDDANAALITAQAQQKTKETALATVNEALAKGTEAAKLLGNDNEVAQAVAVFQARVTKLTGEVDAAKKSVADQTPGVEAALAKLNEARHATDTPFQQLAEARKPIDDLKVQMVAAQNRQREQSTLAQRLKKRGEVLQALRSYPQHKSAIAGIETALAAAQTEQIGATQSMETQVAEVNKMTTAMLEVEKVAANTRQQLDAAKTAQSTKQASVQAVATAIEKTELAVAALPDAADLKSALETLKSRLEPLQKELTVLDQAVATRDAEHQTAAAQMKTAQDAVAAAQNELAARKQSLEAKAAAVAQATEQKNAETAALNDALTQFANGWTADFSVRDLKQLTPDQMGWSILQACGIVDGYRSTVDAELEKTVTKASVENDPAQKANRAAQLEFLTREKLLPAVAPFSTFYGAAPGQPQDDFFATADQALFLANGGSVRTWIVPGTGLFERLNAQADPKILTDELYLSVLTRRPTDLEVADVTNFLAARPTERAAVVQELIWGLLASAEFRFQH